MALTPGILAGITILIFSVVGLLYISLKALKKLEYFLFKPKTPLKISVEDKKEFIKMLAAFNIDEKMILLKEVFGSNTTFLISIDENDKITILGAGVIPTTTEQQPGDYVG